MTDRPAPFREGSLLHRCDAVLTDLVRRGIDPSLVHPDRLVAAVAIDQHGVITRAQLSALEVGRGVIRRRLERGVLHPLHRGVFLWGLSSPTDIGRAVAAVYACGDGAVLSYDATAGLWDVRPPCEGAMDVTVVGRQVRRPGIRAHQVAALSSADIRTLHGIPVTSPARTLFDIASRLTSHEFADAVEQAQIKRLVARRDLAAVIERAPGRPGAPAVRAVISEPAFTRSRAERMLVGLVRAAGLPSPAFNTKIAGFEVDAVWRIERVILEFDSLRFHATRAGFDRDRRRDAVHTRAGYLVLRSTWTELREHSYALVVRVAEALALARAGDRAALIAPRDRVA